MTNDNKPLYGIEEATNILQEALGSKAVPNREAVTILALEDKIDGALENNTWLFSRNSLARHITQERLIRSKAAELTQETQGQYLRQRYLTWCEALYLFHGVEPSDTSAESAGFMFPIAYWRLHSAVNAEEIGTKQNKNKLGTSIDTPRNWMEWFNDSDHMEPWWLSPLVDSTTKFERLLLKVSAQDSPNAKSEAQAAKYDKMAQCLYRVKAENPSFTLDQCAEVASEYLKEQDIETTPGSIRRRTGPLNQSVLQSLQAAIERE